jgi:hypothetical protein
MNDIRTVSFTYDELHKIKVALGYALTNPYNPPETERVLYSARDKVAEALKRPNIEDVYQHIAEHGEKHLCATCDFFTPYDDKTPNCDGRCHLGYGTYGTHTLLTQEACCEYKCKDLDQKLTHFGRLINETTKTQHTKNQ